MKLWYLIPVLLVLLITPALAAVNFVASPNYGVAPLTVHFTDQSDVANTWRWNFGDGDIQSINGGSGSTSHTYSSPGVYTVSMTVNGVSTVSYRVTVIAPTTVPTPIQTTVPTTVSTTIPPPVETTIQTTEPTTIPTQIPTTDQATIITTPPTTLPTTEIITIATTIETTIPTTTSTTVPTGSVTTQPTTAVTTAPQTEQPTPQPMQVPTTSYTYQPTTVTTTDYITATPTTEPSPSPIVTETPSEQPLDSYDDKSLTFTLPYLNDNTGKPILIKIYLGDFIYIIRRN